MGVIRSLKSGQHCLCDWRETPLGCRKGKVIKGGKGAEERKLLAKDPLFSARMPGGEQKVSVNSPVLSRKFHVDWLKVLFQGG